MTLTIRRLALATSVVLLATGCGGTPAAKNAPERTGRTPSRAAATASPSARTLPTTSPSTHDPRRLVLDISIDGLNPTALTDVGIGNLPGFQELVRHGSSTLDARSSLEQTHTLPNHTGMMTGLPVGGAYGHQTVMNNDDGTTLEQQDGRYVPGMFDVAHDAGLRTAMYVGKEKFRFLIRSWDRSHGAVDTSGRNNGRNKIDYEEIAPSAQLAHDVVEAMTSRDPAALTFLHLPLTDTVGHKFGFMSRRYIQAVQTIDGYLSDILNAIDRVPSLMQRTTVIVTADHGGRGPNHDDAASAENYTIPFFVWGRGVANGTDLYSLNPGRQDPGAGRPGYSGPQPVRNMDVADLSLNLLGLRQLPHTLSTGESVLRVR